MSKHENIAAASEATASVELVPLANLYLHPDNPRQEADAEGIEALAESLAVCGLMQNLGGIREEDGRVGVIFGGRRLRALQIAVEKNPALAVVPVRIAPNHLTALAWATAENTARQDMTPAQEIRAYGKMRDSGAPVGSIARAFAVQENHVYRRLALADLPAPILKALEEKQISLGQAAAFTVANDEKLALEVLGRAKSNSFLSEVRIKSLLQPQSINSTDRRARFVGLATYTAAGGTLTQDLFADESEALLHEDDLLDRLFAERLEDEATKLVEAEGWKWVSTFEGEHVPWDYTDKNKLAKLYAKQGELSDAEADELQTLEDLQQDEELDDAGAVRLAELTAKTEVRFTEAQKALAGGLVYVDYSGKLCSEMGLVKPEDAGVAIEAGLLAPNRHSATTEEPKSPYSQKLVADMKALRLASVQGALLGKPELVLDLLAFALSGEADRGIFDIQTGSPENVPSVTAGCEIDPRLMVKRSPFGDSRPEAFLTFQEKGKKHRNAVLTEAFARLMNYGCTYWSGHDTTLFNHIEEEAKAELRSIWTPNAANFFGRVSGPYLDGLLADLLSAQPTDDRVQAFAKLKKKEKAETMERLFSDADTRKLYRVTPEQAERIAAWHPDCF